MTDVILVPGPAPIGAVVVSVPPTPSVTAELSGPITGVVALNGSITEVDVRLPPIIEVVEMIQQGPPGRAGNDGTMLVQLMFDSAPTLSVVRIRGGDAYKLTSLDYNEQPISDGVLLESGNAGDYRLVAIGQGLVFDTPLAPPGVEGAYLFLSQSGNLTNIQPSVSAGDAWYLPVARKISDTKFAYHPGFPTKLQEPTPPPY